MFVRYHRLINVIQHLRFTFISFPIIFALLFLVNKYVPTNVSPSLIGAMFWTWSATSMTLFRESSEKRTKEHQALIKAQSILLLQKRFIDDLFYSTIEKWRENKLHVDLKPIKITPLPTIEMHLEIYDFLLNQHPKSFRKLSTDQRLIEELKQSIVSRNERCWSIINNKAEQLNNNEDDEDNDNSDEFVLLTEFEESQMKQAKKNILVTFKQTKSTVVESLGTIRQIIKEDYPDLAIIEYED